MEYEFEGLKPRIHRDAFIAPTAVLIGDVEVGAEVSIWYGAVLRGDAGKITIGEGSCIQDNVLIHGNTFVGKDCHISHCAVIHACTLEDGAFVGISATVLDGAVIGSLAMVAAGAVVMEKAVVSPRTVVAGIPARAKKQLSGRALTWVEEGSEFYRRLGRRYKKEGLDRPEIMPLHGSEVID